MTQMSQPTTSNCDDILQDMNVPRNHWDARLSKIPNLPHKATLVKYTSNIVTYIDNGTGLVLFGPYGSGKSASAAICAKAALSQLKFSYWVKGEDLPGIVINRRVDPLGDPIINRLMFADLCIIDELIVRADIKYTEQAADHLIRARADLGKATIMTTNHSANSLKRMYPSLYNITTESMRYVNVAGYDFRADEKGLLK